MPQNDFAASQLSTRLDPVAPAENRPDSEQAASEIKKEMQEIDPSFNGSINLRLSTDRAMSRGMTVTTEVSCGVSLEEVCRLYEEAYIDHAFTFLIDRHPETADISNTNKCLLEIRSTEGGLSSSNEPSIRITAVLDDFIKGRAGTAVHCMNLLFGLSERTGLALKASVV